MAKIHDKFVIELAEVEAWKNDFKGYINALNIPKDDYKGIMEYIDELPSAQPETVRCKDCKFQDKGCNEAESWNLCGYRPWLHVPTEDEHYCGYAVRKENR